MKLAFSNSMCPELDLETLIEKSRAWGYQGFELVAPHGQSDLGLAATLHVDSSGVRDRLAAAGQQIVALGAGVLAVSSDSALEGGRDRVRRAIEIAGEIDCPLVVVSGAPMPAGAGKLRVLDRYATVLHDLAHDASDAGVTLALENAGVLAQSLDLWLVRDAAGSPALRVCLNPLNADRAGDPPTRAMKRLSGALAMVRLSCTRSLPQDGTERFVEVDHTAGNLVFILEQLKGLAYRGWVCLDRASGAADGPGAEELLEQGARFLRAELDKGVTELTAYKGDKNAPKYASPVATP